MSVAESKEAGQHFHGRVPVPPKTREILRTATRVNYHLKATKKGSTLRCIPSVQQLCCSKLSFESPPQNPDTGQACAKEEKDRWFWDRFCAGDLHSVYFSGAGLSTIFSNHRTKRLREHPTYPPLGKGRDLSSKGRRQAHGLPS